MRQMQRKEGTGHNLSITAGGDEEKHFITFEEAISSEGITVLNAHEPNDKAQYS